MLHAREQQPCRRRRATPLGQKQHRSPNPERNAVAISGIAFIPRPPGAAPITAYKRRPLVRHWSRDAGL